MSVKIFPTRTGPFVPSDLSEVFCWLKADGGSNVLNGSAAAASDGETVDSWISEVGSLTFQNTTDGERPVFTDDATGCNGKPYLLFDDAANQRLVRNGTFQAATLGEMFAVINRDDDDLRAFFALGKVAGGTPYLYHGFRAESAGGQLRHDVSGSAISSASQVSVGPAHLLNIRSDDTNISLFRNRVSVNTAAAGGWYGDATGHDRASIGGLTRDAFTLPFGGKIYELIFCSSVLSATRRAQLLHYLENKYRPLMTCAALGDSIMARGGDGSVWHVGSNPLHKDTSIEGFGFIEWAAANETTTDALARWKTDSPSITGLGYQALLLLSSVNDFDAGSPDAAASFANIETIMDEALTEGLRVFVSTIMPFANGAGWSTSRQTAMEAFNTMIRNKVGDDTTLNLHLVEAYDAFGDTDPVDLLAAYDSGDGIHPNATGDAAFAALLKTAIEGLR